MDYLFRPCTFEMDHKAYVNFLVRHHDELNLPYPFAMKLSFLGSPLIYGRAALVFELDAYEPVGAVGFAYGTGENDYEDRHVCQMEIVYLSQPFRNGLLFPRLLRSAIELMKEGEPGVDEVRFWAAPRLPEHRRLYAKLLALPGSSSLTTENGLTMYQAKYDELDAYCKRFAALS